MEEARIGTPQPRVGGGEGPAVRFGGWSIWSWREIIWCPHGWRAPGLLLAYTAFARASALSTTISVSFAVFDTALPIA